EFCRAEVGCLTCDKAGMGGEEFAGTRIAGKPQRPVLEIGSVQGERGRVPVWLTGNLAENPIPSAGIRDDDSRAQLGSCQVGKREANYDDLAGCKWAHAASSSGRFQSSAK